MQWRCPRQNMRLVAAVANNCANSEQTRNDGQENKTLRQRVEAARLRVHDLLSRLTFLEEQARESGGNGGGRAAGGPGAAGSAGVAGGAQ